MENIKMTPEMMDAMMKELDAAIAPVGQKYGFKLSFGWGEIINGGLDGTFIVTAEAMFPADYTPEKIAFAKFLAENRYDERYELTADCLGKTFAFAGQEFEIVGALGYFNDKNITVRVDENLYQMSPLFIRDGLNGEIASSMWAQEWKAMKKSAEKFPVLPTVGVCSSMSTSSKSWEWAVKNLPQFQFTEKDFETTVTLYGKQYIICGFYMHKPFRFAVLVDAETEGTFYKVPAYKVQNALGRLKV
jgi:hypothetical protein